MKLRLLPIAIIVASTLLVVKVTTFWQGMETFIAMTFSAQPAHAQSQAPSAVQATRRSATEAGNEGGDARQTPDGNGVSDDPMLMSQSEIDLLQKLSERRGELENWGIELTLREQLLKAAELRIESKLADLKDVQDKIKSSLKQHDDEQEAKLKSLVKIYETMKPKDSARIFEKLDMPILLDVIERMKEAKAAPVIAAMDSEKAKNLTTEMAKRRRLAGEESQRTAAQVSRAD